MNPAFHYIRAAVRLLTTDEKIRLATELLADAGQVLVLAEPETRKAIAVDAALAALRSIR